MTKRIRLDQDWHVHTPFSVGTDSIEEILIAAEARDLSTVCLVDRCRPNSDWVGDFVFEARRAAAESPVEVLCAIEVPLRDLYGKLAIPAGAKYKVDHIFVSDDVLPTPEGPISVEEAREEIAAGKLFPASAAEWLVRGAASAALTHENVVLARPFSLLGRLGLRIREPHPILASWLAKQLAEAGAGVELSENWRSLSPAVISTFLRTGVPVLASTGARSAAKVGAYSWSAAALDQIPDPLDTGLDVNDLFEMAIGA